MSAKKTWRFLFALGLPIVVLGCGSDYDIVPVRGRVTYDGQPVPEMIVKFQPREGRASESGTKADGSFEMVYTIDKNGDERDKDRVIVYWSPPSDKDGSDKDGLKPPDLGPFDE